MGRRVEPLTRPFRDWPIKQKLLAIILATTTLALILAAVGIVVSDSILFRNYLGRDLSTLAQIIADNSTGALAFDDAKVGAETLGALHARPHVMGACILRPDQTVLAHYFRPGSESSCPPGRNYKEIRFLADRLVLSQPIVLSKKPIGTLTLSYDLGEIGARQRLYSVLVIGILLVSSLLAAILSSRLRTFIAMPVASLVETATAVSKTRNYKIRAEKVTGDEMGVLVDAFNEMLGRIASGDEELREALASREEANRRLARLNKDLECFAFVASHDLQEPLRMITVYLQLLQRRSFLDPGPEAAEFVSNIMRGARRMRELLGDLRAYAELGTETDRPAAVDLNVVITKAKDNLAVLLDNSNAVITSDVLPSVQVYEGHLIPLFQNLIGNAIKYRGDQPPQIDISCHRDGSELHFAVADKGIGIAPEYHDRIFAPFKRLHGGDVPGSGIGLAICQRVVERYGGRIWVESESGQGATFRFTLPVALLVPVQPEGS